MKTTCGKMHTFVPWRFGQDARTECLPRRQAQSGRRRTTRAIKGVLMALWRVCFADDEAPETPFLNFAVQPSRI
jgi:hypothetical protein